MRLSKDYQLTYPAILTVEGNATLARFPDCPGCQTFVRTKPRHGSIVTAATDALHGWLICALKLPGGPDAPTTGHKIPAGGALMMVPVPPALAKKILRRWAR